MRYLKVFIPFLILAAFIMSSLQFKATYAGILMSSPKHPDITIFPFQRPPVVSPYEINQISSSSYEISYGTSKVVVGDSTSTDFKPQIELTGWNGEVRTRLGVPKLNNITMTGATKATTDGQKITWAAANNIDFEYYPLAAKAGMENGGFEYEIIFRTKPAVTTFSLSMPVDNTNLVWYYQPPLTAQEIADGAYRPDNVVGSYAVYHNSKRNNQYKTGKLFHLYRIELIDAEGKRAWGSYNSDVQSTGFLNWNFTIPANFVYPVRVDPTFGYTSIGASSDNWGNYIGFESGVPAQSGTVDTISVYTKDFTAGVKTKTALYAHTSATEAGALLGTTSEKVITAKGQWEVYTIVAPAPNVTAGTSYHLALWANDNWLVAHDTGGANELSYKAQTYAASWPDPGGTGTNGTYLLSMYADYTVAGPSATPEPRARRTGQVF